MKSLPVNYRRLLCIAMLGYLVAPLPAGTSEADAAGNVPETKAHRTFFVDSETGCDGADGLAEDRAWRSLQRLNAAELRPGDTVRLKCGGVWRGSLLPKSGDSTAPITYTSYGQGPKPLLLGSQSRSRPEDWVNVEGNLWATRPMEYRLGECVVDLRNANWSRHQEAGARVAVKQQDAEGGRILQLTCDNSGKASNHVQLWGPRVPVERGQCLVMTFRARCGNPFQAPRISICRGASPWTLYAAADIQDWAVGPEWKECQAAFDVVRSSDEGRLHINLGGILPPGAVLEFQPQGLYAATPSVADPLSVDVGNIIFDHGKVCGWKKWSVDALEKPYDYFYDRPSGRVYLYCPANPATLHRSIECAMKRHVVHQGGVHHVTYDGLAVKYGAAHGFGGGSTHHLVIRNCDLAYIGGGHQCTRPGGRPVRYGNAIEFWGAAHDNLVEGCRISEVYDAALTNQNKSVAVRQENIVYRNNLIWNCEYSFEYWNRPESSVTRNIRFVNNTCINAGHVWSHAQRPDPNGSHLMFYSNVAATSGFEVKYNIFCGVTDWGSRYSSGWKPLPEMDHNLWFSRQGVMAHWFGKRIEGFEEYQETTGLDAHSRFAEPQFLDPDGGDYRLAPDSPARCVGPDGRPVGAVMLWNAGGDH